MSEEIKNTQENAAESAAPVESMEDYAAELEASLKQGPPNDDPVWDKFETMLAEKTVFPVKIDSVVKAGVVAYVDDVRAFIPASKLAAGYVENLEDYKGKTIDVMVITADKENKKLVLSGKEVARQKAREAKAAACGSCRGRRSYGRYRRFPEGLRRIHRAGRRHVRSAARFPDQL